MSIPLSQLSDVVIELVVSNLPCGRVPPNRIARYSP